MSRSYKKTPILGICSAQSEKMNKRKANRSLRKIVKIKIKKGYCILPFLREVSDVWNFAKDGKLYHKKPKPEWMRK